MFEDKRSRKVIVMVHCLLNQNARLSGYANYKGAIPEIVEYLLEKGYGMLQIPCPELLIMGLDRSSQSSETPDIRDVLEQPENRRRCRKIAEDITLQIRTYIDNGFLVTAVIGNDGSPSCGVTSTFVGEKTVDGSGVFIEELKQVFEETGVNVPIIGMTDEEGEVNKMLSWFKEHL